MHLSQKNPSAASEQCLDDGKEIVSACKLQLNPYKTELIIFGSNRQRDRFKTCFPIDTLDNPICPGKSVKDFSVNFDSHFSMSKHVQNV